MEEEDLRTGLKQFWKRGSKEENNESFNEKCGAIARIYTLQTEIMEVYDTPMIEIK